MKMRLALIGLLSLIAFTGLQRQAHARWMNMQSGRFTARDPIGYRGGINLYGYVGNRPNLMIDPVGLNPEYDAKKVKPKYDGTVFDKCTVYVIYGHTNVFEGASKINYPEMCLIGELGCEIGKKGPAHFPPPKHQIGKPFPRPRVKIGPGWPINWKKWRKEMRGAAKIAIDRAKKEAKDCQCKCLYWNVKIRMLIPPPDRYTKREYQKVKLDYNENIHFILRSLRDPKAYKGGDLDKKIPRHQVDDEFVAEYAEVLHKRVRCKKNSSGGSAWDKGGNAKIYD